MSTSTAGATPAPSPPAPAVTTRTAAAIAGVLLGAVISYLNTRLTSFGLADLRGAVHAGFDEGAWITTANAAAQMVAAPFTPVLGAVFTPRRVLVAAAAVFAAASAVLPFAPDLPAVLLLQVVRGLSVGVFLPLTLSLILVLLPPQLWLYGLASYGTIVNLSSNVSATIEGFFTDTLSWAWIFWVNCLLAPAMAALLLWGLPPQPVNPAPARAADWAGILYAASGFSLLYAAIDQGNRLDWFGSGLIVALLAGGGLLVILFLVTEARSPAPFITGASIGTRNLLLLMAVLVTYRFVTLGSGYIVPQYLATVQGYRSLQTGDVLLWIAVPALLLAPAVAWVVRRSDGRLVMAVGLLLLVVSSRMTMELTAEWASADFLPSQVLQAVGQSLVIVALLDGVIGNADIKQAASMGAAFQILRLFGGELGTGLMTTLVRVREQVHSYALGLHVQAGSSLVQARLSATAAGLSGDGATAARPRATVLLGQAVRTQAEVLSYIDGYAAVGVACLFAMLLLALMGPKPPPPPSP